MRKIKIAQIGTSKNSHGNMIWQSLIKQNDLFEVIGYAFPENEREKFPKEAIAFEGYREMTVEEILSSPEIEAVAVETEEIYLTKYVVVDFPEYDKIAATLQMRKQLIDTTADAIIEDNLEAFLELGK